MLQALKKYQDFIYQFCRFAGIGFLNTAVDFSVINILISLTQATSGWPLAAVNTASFSIAVFHSFFWNKFWAFGNTRQDVGKFIFQLALAGTLGLLVILSAVFGASREYSWLYFALLFLGLLVLELIMWQSFGLRVDGSAAGQVRQFSLFLVVSIIGIIINSTVVGLVTAYIPPQFGANAILWANMAKVLATGIALIWNFIGYKFLVFKK